MIEFTDGGQWAAQVERCAFNIKELPPCHPEDPERHFVATVYGHIMGYYSDGHGYLVEDKQDRLDIENEASPYYLVINPQQRLNALENEPWAITTPTKP